MRSIERVMEMLERALTVAVGILMGMLALLVSWQVFSRYVLKASPYWIEEFSVTALMWIGLLGAAAGVWGGSHMSLELLVKRLPDTARVWTEVCIDTAIGLFAWFLCTQGWVLTAATMDSVMATIPIPLGITYVALPVAGGFMMLFGFTRAAHKLVLHYGAADRKASHG
jgi:TRAP-type C4-dicarboxylate transport system permease small subunit